MTNTYVERLLIEKFKTLQGLVIDEEGNFLDVAFPNESFTRPEDGYWYEIYFTSPSVLPQKSELAGRLKWVGVMQINICVPTNSGTDPMYDRYDNIYNLFPTGSVIDNGVRILETSNTTAIDDGDYYVMPVSVVWQAYLEK